MTVAVPSRQDQYSDKGDKDTDALEYEDGVIDRPTEELVIGMVGAVGAGVSMASGVLAKMLSDEYGYEVTIVKASEIIRDNASKTTVAEPPATGAPRITGLQEIGTDLRKRFGEDYIAAKAIERIAASRSALGG